ncbi:MAG: desulfoferrodoxin family protein [Armatimonadota bacterium]
METSRRDFLRTALVGGLAAAAITLPALQARAQEPTTEGGYQYPKDPAHLNGLEQVHWPKLEIVGKPQAGETLRLMIQIGQTIHPMTPDHHIMWTEVWADDKRVARMDFDEPLWIKPVLTVMLVDLKPSTIKVRLRCNLHGLWENTIKV